MISPDMSVGADLRSDHSLAKEARVGPGVTASISAGVTNEWANARGQLDFVLSNDIDHESVFEPSFLSFSPIRPTRKLRNDTRSYLMQHPQIDTHRAQENLDLSQEQEDNFPPMPSLPTPPICGNSLVGGFEASQASKLSAIQAGKRFLSDVGHSTSFGGNFAAATKSNENLHPNLTEAENESLLDFELDKNDVLEMELNSLNSGSNSANFFPATSVQNGCNPAEIKPDAIRPDEIGSKINLEKKLKPRKIKIRVSRKSQKTKPLAPISLNASRSKGKRGSSKKGIQPTNNDILRGRGGMTNRHPGNQRFRDEARKLRCPYRDSSTSRQQKYLLSTVLVDRVKTYGGRFLEKSANGSWQEMSAAAARKKASQVLREEKWD